MRGVGKQLRTRQVLLQYGVTAVVIVLASVVLHRLVDVSTVRRMLADVKLGPYLVAVALFYMTFPLRAVRWRRLLRNVEVEMGQGSATLLLVVNWFLNTVLPAKLGDAHRGYVTGQQHETSTSTVLGTIAAERAFDLAVLAVGIVLAMTLIIGDFSGAQRQIVWTAFGLFVVVGVGVGGVVLLRPSILPDRVQPLVADFKHGLMAVRSPTEFAYVVGLTVVMWSLNVFRMSMVGVAIGFRLDLSLLVLVALVVAFLSGLPYTPAGLGVVELVTTAVLIQAGIDRELGFSFVLFDRMITVGSLVLIGTGTYLYFKFVWSQSRSTTDDRSAT